MNKLNKKVIEVIKKYYIEEILLLLIINVICIGFIIDNKKDNYKKNIKKDSMSFYSAKIDDKWGVIDNNGEIVIDIDYNYPIIIPNLDKDVFIIKSEDKVNSDNYKYRAIDSNKKTIFSDFDEVFPIFNYDKDKNVIYNLDVLKVRKGNKYGLINYNGDEIIDCDYDNIYALDNVQNSIIVENDNKKGLVNNNGDFIFDCKCLNILNITNNYKNGYITVDENNRYGIIDYTGKKIIENQYTGIESKIINDKFIVKNNNKFALISNEDNCLLESNDEIINANDCSVIIKKGEQYYLIDYNGKLIFENGYDYIQYAGKNNIIVKKNNLYGIIEKNGNVLKNFVYSSITYHENGKVYEIEKKDNYESEIYDENLVYKFSGIISEYNNEKKYMKIYCKNDYKYYDFNFNEIYSNIECLPIIMKKNNLKYGFIDNDNKLIVDYIYDEARNINKLGYAAVKKDNLWGCIDKSGNVVLNPKYELKDNLVIDFIGKWHLSKDFNYYTVNEE